MGQQLRWAAGLNQLSSIRSNPLAIRKGLTEPHTNVGPVVQEPAPELFNQRKKVETARYRLLVDRQLKGSFTTSEAADAAGLLIKQGHPIVQVVVYDVVEGINKAIEPEKV
jgi:hypothetical protein